MTPKQFLELVGCKSWYEIHWTLFASTPEPEGYKVFLIGFPDKTGKIVPFAKWCVK